MRGHRIIQGCRTHTLVEISPLMVRCPLMPRDSKVGTTTASNKQRRPLDGLGVGERVTFSGSFLTAKGSVPDGDICTPKLHYAGISWRTYHNWTRLAILSFVHFWTLKYVQVTVDSFTINLHILHLVQQLCNYWEILPTIVSSEGDSQSTVFST